MLRIDFSKLCLLVRDEHSRMRLTRRALPRRIDANNSGRLPISRRFVFIGGRAQAVAALIHSSFSIEKACAVA